MATNTTLVRMIRLDRRLKKTHQRRRIDSSIRIIKEDAARHTKTSPDIVKIGGELNRYILMGSTRGYYGVKVSIERSGPDILVDLADRKKPSTIQTQKKEEKKSVVGRLTERTDAEKQVEKKIEEGKSEAKPKEKKAPKKQESNPKTTEKQKPASEPPAGV